MTRGAVGLRYTVNQQLTKNTTQDLMDGTNFSLPFTQCARHSKANKSNPANVAHPKVCLNGCRGCHAHRGRPEVNF